VKNKVLFEDFVNYYNKWTSGIASRELGSQRVTLKDLFDKSINQSPNDVRVEKPHPYPLPNVIEQIGNLYLNAENSKNLFKSSLSNPLISKNKDAKEQVQIIIDRLDIILKELDSIIDASKKPVAKAL